MNATKAGIALLNGNAAAFILRLARNIIIARAISVEDFGIASTFMIVVTFIQMTTNLSLTKLIIQNKAGDDQDFIAAVTGVNVLRGVLVSALMFLCAGFFARVLGQGDLAPVYQLVAILPLMSCFKHPDISRLQRQLKFRISILTNTLPLLLTVLAVWPLALWLQDYRVMLAVYMMQFGFTVIISHALAERPYRIGWQNKVALQAVKFGLPILLGGLAIFVQQQGDRVLVSRFYGAEMLGYFSAAVTLTMPFANQVALLGQQLFLPIMAAQQSNDTAFDYRATFTLQAMLASGLLGVLGFGLLGPPVMVLAFGEKYAPAMPLVGLAGIIFALQLPRTGVVTVAMARGHTMNILLTNIVRIAFLPVAIWIALQGGSVVDMLLVGVAGQATAYVFGLWLLVRNTRVGCMRSMMLPHICAIICLGAALAALTRAPDTRMQWDDPLVWLCMLAFLSAIATSQVMLRELIQRLPSTLALLQKR